MMSYTANKCCSYEFAECDTSGYSVSHSADMLHTVTYTAHNNIGVPAHHTHANTHVRVAGPLMKGRLICFQLGCTLFLFAGRTKRWIQFQDMLLMKLNLKHVSDWRTKTENQKLLQRWPGLKRAHSSKHQLLTKRQLQTRPLQASCSCNNTKRPAKRSQAFYLCYLELQFVLKTLWHMDKPWFRLLMTSRDVKAKNWGYWNLGKLWRNISKITWMNGNLKHMLQ